MLPAINPSTFTKKSKCSYNTSMEFFDTMRDNALFLLDLNSHNGGLINKPTVDNLMTLRSKTNVRYSSASDFVQPNKFAQRFSATITDETTRKSSIPKQHSVPNYYSKRIPISSEEALTPELLWTPPENITCLELLNNRSSGSDCHRVFSSENFHDPCAVGLQHNKTQQASFNESKFHRSISMIQGWGFCSNVSTNDCHGNQIHQNNDNIVVMRRKKTCLCESSK